MRRQGASWSFRALREDELDLVPGERRKKPSTDRLSLVHSTQLGRKMLS